MPNGIETDEMDESLSLQPAIPSSFLLPSSPTSTHQPPTLNLTLQQPTSSSALTIPPLTQQSLKKRKKSKDDRLDKAFKLLTGSLSNSLPDDESQDFGNFVAKKLTKYSYKTQGAIQNAIMGIFLNADNGLYEQTYTYNVCPPFNHIYGASTNQSIETSNNSNPLSPHTSSKSENMQVPTIAKDTNELLDFDVLNQN